MLCRVPSGQRLDREGTKPEAKSAAENGEHAAFDKQLADNTTSPGAERRANVARPRST
jgi:hypothetical protein